MSTKNQIPCHSTAEGFLVLSEMWIAVSSRRGVTIRLTIHAVFPSINSCFIRATSKIVYSGLYTHILHLADGSWFPSSLHCCLLYLSPASYNTGFINSTKSIYFVQIIECQIARYLINFFAGLRVKKKKYLLRSDVVEVHFNKKSK